MDLIEYRATTFRITKAKIPLTDNLINGMNGSRIELTDMNLINKVDKANK